MSLDILPVNLNVAIAYRHLGNERTAIKEKLNGMKSQYIPEADGILISWCDLQILNEKGIIIDDQPFVFWKINFTAKVFKPIQGKLVKGRVRQILRNYFLAQAMDSFVVTVSIPEEFVNHHVIQKLMIEQEVYFKIKGSLKGAHMGEIDEQCLELTSTTAISYNEDEVYDYAKDFEY